MKEENYINSNTSLDTFLYLFGNVDNVPERFYIEWLASLKELHVLIDVFWKSERNRWKKASEIFLYGDEFLKYRSLTTAVSKEDDIEDIEKKSPSLKMLKLDIDCFLLFFLYTQQYYPPTYAVPNLHYTLQI